MVAAIVVLIVIETIRLVVGIVFGVARLGLTAKMNQMAENALAELDGVENELEQTVKGMCNRCD